MTPLLTGVFASQITGKLNTFSPTGSYDALATYTVPTGGVSNIVIGGLPTGGQYKHLQLRIMARTGNNTAGNNIGTYLRFNGETTGYRWHELYGVNGSTGGYTDTSQFIYTATYAPRNGDTAGTYSAQIVDILDYDSVNKYKTVRTISGDDLNGTGFFGLMTGLYQNTSPISTIGFYSELDGFAAGTKISIYGVKG